MRLVKYYLDCVTDEGTVVVIYSAILELGPLKIPYECIIIKHPNSRTRQFQSFRRGRLDRFGGGQWRNDYLQGSGLWEGGQDVGSQHLLQTEQGDIFWHCFTIGSDVTIVHGQNRYLGKGYGEVVEIPYRFGSCLLLTLDGGDGWLKNRNVILFGLIGMEILL